ncbi:hypothetical protein BO71DRAFT_6467 [Aspergillus ellipticus CBS 707.79]|uniref:Uncharacterized protein n=1 Tax=Aspergillus ellipticus CBS 707.79 TaxID=1448320 RepID=A0A319DPH3_9EURO|nr:hypothetical protein BO71DRAFT_6467 [Aspergillus ellipticus CBS 707.79]
MGFHFVPCCCISLAITDHGCLINILRGKRSRRELLSPHGLGRVMVSLFWIMFIICFWLIDYWGEGACGEMLVGAVLEAASCVVDFWRMHLTAAF